MTHVRHRRCSRISAGSASKPRPSSIRRLYGRAIAAVQGGIPGAHSKNLFVKDKKGRFFLITAKDDAGIDLKRVTRRSALPAASPSAQPDSCASAGGRARFRHARSAFVNDRAGEVTMILDATLMEHERVNFHPLVNTMTTAISREDLLRFLRSTGHEPHPAVSGAEPRITGPCEAAGTAIEPGRRSQLHL